MKVDITVVMVIRVCYGDVFFTALSWCWGQTLCRTRSGWRDVLSAHNYLAFAFLPFLVAWKKSEYVKIIINYCVYDENNCKCGCHNTSYSEQGRDMDYKLEICFSLKYIKREWSPVRFVNPQANRNWQWFPTAVYNDLYCGGDCDIDLVSPAIAL